MTESPDFQTLTKDAIDRLQRGVDSGVNALYVVRSDAVLILGELDRLQRGKRRG